jgi:hypothetical protein
MTMKTSINTDPDASPPRVFDASDELVDAKDPLIE